MVFIASVFAGVCAYMAALGIFDAMQRKQARETLRMHIVSGARRAGASMEERGEEALSARVRLVVRLACQPSHHEERSNHLRSAGKDPANEKGAGGVHSSKTNRSSDIEMEISHAGLSDLLDGDGLAHARLRVSFLSAIAMGCAIAAADIAFAPVGAVIGWLAGGAWPMHVIKSEARRRKAEFERELPNMLDIVALCAQAGMSFDAAFNTYMQRSDSLLSVACRKAFLCYQQGLSTRDEALQSLSRELGIDAFTRFAATAAQAIKFGAPLASSMRELASEIREGRRSEVAEKVAKAPIKMLVPTGTLILPAMLLLVLGPVVLNLVGEAG